MNSDYSSYNISKESHPEKILTRLGLDKDNQIFYCTMKINGKEHKVGIIVPANVKKDEVVRIFESHKENIGKVTSERKGLKKDTNLLTLHADGSLTSKQKTGHVIRHGSTANKVDEKVNERQHPKGQISELLDPKRQIGDPKEDIEPA